MPESREAVHIEQDLRPAYYDKFRCLMSGCQLNCCRDDWQINFGKKDYLTVKKQKGSPELNRRLAHCLRRTRGEAMSEEHNYGQFTRETGQCPLLSEDCLCMLQQEKGAKVLPEVCRVFPRKRYYAPSGYLERSLSPACEGVLALLWDLPEGVDFVSDPLPENEKVFGNYKESNLLAPAFQEIRALCIDLLQDRRFPLAERVMMVGLALKPLAERETDIPRWLALARALPETAQAAGLLAGVEREKALPLFLTNAVTVLFSSKNRGNDMMPLRLAAASWLGMGNEGDTRRLLAQPYLTAQARFDQQFAGREYFMENLAVSVFFNMGLPNVDSPEGLWKSYLNFCNLYAMYRFVAVMSCREGAPGDRDELFRLLVHISRALLHSKDRQIELQDALFQNDSATLAHMAVLLSG